MEDVRNSSEFCGGQEVRAQTSFWLRQHLCHRVFSLHPIENYRPPMLSGHKDTLVGVFFTGAAADSAAELNGTTALHMLTVSRDGALYAWQFHSDQPQPHSQHDDGVDELSEADARPSKRLKAASSTNYAGALLPTALLFMTSSCYGTVSWKMFFCTTVLSMTCTRCGSGSWKC